MSDYLRTRMDAMQFQLDKLAKEVEHLKNDKTIIHHTTQNPISFVSTNTNFNNEEQ